MTEESAENPLAEDSACPVEVEPGVDYATPADWQWRQIGASMPSKATFPINHSDVTRVTVDVLRASDSPPEAPLVVSRDIPIIIIDSIDKYWASESRVKLPLQGLRVPVEGDTLEEAKRALALDLARQLRLLLLLTTSHQGQIAAPLRANFDCLKSFLAPRPAIGKPQA
jgi:hypothetical protein